MFLVQILEYLGSLHGFHGGFSESSGVSFQVLRLFVDSGLDFLLKIFSYIEDILLMDPGFFFEDFRLLRCFQR